MAKGSGNTILQGMLDGTISLDKGLDLLNNMRKASEDANSAIEDLGDAFQTFSKLSIDNTKTLDGTIRSFNFLTKAAFDFSNSMGDMSKLGAVIGLDKAFSAAIGPIEDTISIMSKFTSAAQNAAAVLDGMDEGTRELNSSQFKLAANIGLGYDQAKKFGEVYKEIVRSNSDLATTGFYINPEEFKAATNALQQQGFAMTDLAEKSSVAGKSLNNIQAMTMQAKAMGMDVGEYSKKMGDMVRKSGLSMEDSMKLMASTQDIARDTGLRIDEVTQSLDSATSGFQRMGTTMAFGMPVLKGFAASVAEVGLGISQAGDLAADFSKSLLGIVNNPALAYITSMKGGFSGAMGGGGGVLNPSIQMQAMMLDQTPGSQQELAKNISMGMSETLKSFSGGNIVSVKEAAASPELQSRFYSQQQMLGSMFGISDTATQNRVLEYLQKLEEATYAGDEETAASLEKQISEAAKGNDQTMSIQEKISLAMDHSVSIARDQYATQKGILVATMMGVKNKEGKEGEDLLISNFGKEMNRLGDKLENVLGIGEGTDETSDQDSAKQTAERLAAAANKQAGLAPDSGGAGGSSGAGSGRSSVASGTNPNSTINLNIVVEDKTANKVDITGGVGGSSRPTTK